MVGTKEEYQYPITGYWWDIINQKRLSGQVDSVQTEVVKNTITLPIRVLIAALLKGHSGYLGIVYHAVGQGDISWDASLPSAGEGDYPLTAEEFRKAPTLFEWIDPGTGDPSGTPSRIIRVKTVFEYGELEQSGVYIREQGLFGGTATGVAGTGEMVDNIRHKKIWKDKDTELIRYIKLEF